MLLLRLLAFAAGAVAVAGTVLSAVSTFVLPRGAPAALTRTVFVTVRWFFDRAVARRRDYLRRDALMALFAPVSLVVLPFVWLVIVLFGFTLMLWGNGDDSWRDAFVVSGSSMLTLGFAVPGDLPDTALAFLSVTIALGLLAMLIAYLPTIYAAFSRRETAVALLDARANTPPSAVDMIERYHRIRGLDELDELWPVWEMWFAEVEESHTSLASLSFFRSPQPHRSWVTAAGAVLDTAALVASTIDRPPSPEAELCVRSGYVALRTIADYFGIEYDTDPRQGDPISITRQEYDGACERLEAIGVPIKADRDQAWLDFAGWRVNYDIPLIALAGLVMAPHAPWSSDRALPYRRPPLLARRSR